MPKENIFLRQIYNFIDLKVFFWKLENVKSGSIKNVEVQSTDKSFPLTFKWAENNNSYPCGVNLKVSYPKSEYKDGVNHTGGKIQSC